MSAAGCRCFFFLRPEKEAKRARGGSKCEPGGCCPLWTPPVPPDWALFWVDPPTSASRGRAGALRFPCLLVRRSPVRAHRRGCQPHVPLGLCDRGAGQGLAITHLTLSADAQEPAGVRCGGHPFGHTAAAANRTFPWGCAIVGQVRGPAAWGALLSGEICWGVRTLADCAGVLLLLSQA